MMIQFDDYRQNAERLWALESGEVFSNSKPDHAAAILETFFTNASRISIFCRNLASSVYGSDSMLATVQSALDRGAQVEIVCQEEPQAKALVEILQNHKHNRVTFKVAKPGSPLSSLKANFAVADGRAYRFEKNKENHRAVACMNDRLMAGELDQLFTQVLQMLGEKRLPAHLA